MASPAMILFAPSVAIWLGAQSWRRKQLKRAARDLPTRVRRLLGPEPEFLPPETAETSSEMAEYVRLHRRTRRIMNLFGLLACLWLLFAAWLVFKGSMP